MGKKRWRVREQLREEGIVLLRLGAVVPGGLGSHFVRFAKVGTFAVAALLLELQGPQPSRCWLEPG